MKAKIKTNTSKKLCLVDALSRIVIPSIHLSKIR
jgi:hypothetical protein